MQAETANMKKSGDRIRIGEIFLCYAHLSIAGFSSFAITAARAERMAAGSVTGWRREGGKA